MASTDPVTSNLLQTPEKSRPVPVSPPRSDQISTSQSNPPWSTKTPTKLPQPPRAARYRHSVRTKKLPERLEMLSTLFNALDAALRLLRMRKTMPSFSKLRAMVECMTDRRLTYGHLAQMKFLLPEEIAIKRVLLPVEETSCVKYDLHITINPSMTNNDRKRKRGTKIFYLRDVFHMRLLEFHKNHPKGTSVPEERLPEPFNKLEQGLTSEATDDSTSITHVTASPVGALEQVQPSRASHLAQSFKPRFSVKQRPTLQSPSKYPSYSSDVAPGPPPERPCHPTNKPSKSLSAAENYVADADPFEIEPPQGTTPQRKLASLTKEIVYATEVGAQKTPEKLATPAKQLATPAKQLMSTTPDLQPPKLPTMSLDEDYTCLSKFVKRPPCARSLQFDSPVMNANIELEVNDTNYTEVLDIIPDGLLQSLKEKERKNEEQAERQRVIKFLPKLFDRIYYFFQSIRTASIGRQALIQELTTRHCDIVDESEIEQQLKLLEEILPDWIFEKMSPRGSTVLCISKNLSPDMLRARLEKAA